MTSFNGTGFIPSFPTAHRRVWGAPFWFVLRLVGFFSGSLSKWKRSTQCMLPGTGPTTIGYMSHFLGIGPSKKKKQDEQKALRSKPFSVFFFHQPHLSPQNADGPKCLRQLSTRQEPKDEALKAGSNLGFGEFVGRGSRVAAISVFCRNPVWLVCGD